MIKWTDIDNEVEEFQSGYKAGFVAIFKKYEGQDTDEVDARGARLKVSQNTFAERYGIKRTTFQNWVKEETNRPAGGPTRPGLNEKMAKAAAEAAAKATAIAEAKAAKALADALAKAELDQRKALLAQKQEQERAAKAKAEAIRKEEQAKAKEAAAKEIAELKAKLSDAANSAGFDVSTMTEAQKAQVMTMLANDPEKAKEWFAAQTAERSRKLADAEAKAKEDAKRKQSQMAEREARHAAQRARQDYDASVLKDFIAFANTAKQLRAKLLDKPVTFDHVLTSGRSAAEWVKMTELVEDVAVEVRESIFSVNAEQELSDL